jgi:hypothetical protein
MTAIPVAPGTEDGGSLDDDTVARDERTPEVADIVDVAFEGPIEITPKGARAALTLELAEANEAFLKKKAG